MQAQRLHEAGAAGALAQRGHPQERVADDDAQAELLAPIAFGDDDDAGDPRGVRAQPPAVDEAEQGVGEGEAGFSFSVFSKASTWQSLRELQVTTVDDVANLSLNATSGFPPFSKSGPELPQDQGSSVS